MKRIITLLIAFVGALSALVAANTQLFLVGGITGWGHLENYELTTTDGNYYVATYPSGSEVELSGDFKLSDPTWNIYNYGGNLQVEAGKSYTLVKNGGNINAVGKIKISKIEFTVSTATLKITGATSANLFDLSKDQGVSLVEYSPANGEKFVSKLTFNGNGVYTGTYTVPDHEFYLKIGGDGNFNTIDYGWNGDYIVLGQSYVLKKGEMQFAAVYPDEGDWKAGDVFDVKVTFTSDWTATLLLTKKAVVPEPEVTITNLQVPAFAETEVGKTTSVTATYTLSGATSATATLSGADATYFKIIRQSVTNGTGSVVIEFAPNDERKFNATLNITSGAKAQSKTITAFGTVTKPVITITNLSIGKFSNTEVGSTSTVTATYTLSGATSATATLSGADATYFKIIKQSVTNGTGSVVIEFIPNDERKFNATLNITSSGVSESVQFSALGTLPPPAEINDLQISTFAVTDLGFSTTATATYKLVNATSATATISGADATYFKILSQNVSNGVGSVEIEFTPLIARKYNATLTISSGSTSESVAFSAIGQEPVIIISNLQTPKFTDAEEDKISTITVTYNLEGAKNATATLSGADVAYFKITYQTVNNGNGYVRIEFTPNIPRKYDATLTITAGNESESVSFNAIAAPAPVAPAIKYLKVEEFDRVRPNVSCTSMITYQLEDASLSDISISGLDAEFFTLKSSGSGADKSYSIVFTPIAAGGYIATLTITTTNGLSASIDFAAVCEDDYTPIIDPVVSISNLKVPAFEATQVGKTSFATATFKVQGTTCATAELSGENARSFKIMSQSVTDGNGEVKIKFVPNKEGEFNATLTVYAGNETAIAYITAISTASEPDPTPTPDPTPDPEPGPGDEPTPDPTPDPEPEPIPDPYPEYPILGYIYIVETEDTKYKNIVKYQPIGDVDEYTLAPEKIDQEIYGLEIYKYEIRDEIYIRYWKEDDTMGSDFRDHNEEGVDITKTPYYANGIWYESIEEMMTWYVRYIPYWNDDISEKMVEESPGVFVATLNGMEDNRDDDYYYYFLGNLDEPIITVGETGYYEATYELQIATGFKANIYLDVNNWETEWKTYYKIVPPGDPWNKDYIDLGLPSGLCWATRNVGANKPQDEGEHFAWGEVESKKDYSYKTYKWANQLKNNAYIKYVTDDYYGLIDFRNTLVPDDDVANVAWGGKWHMPTKLDVEELLRECTTEFGAYYGVEGYFITGPNGNAIFLPGAEQWEDTDYTERGSGGNYWTSTLNEDTQSKAYILQFNLTNIDLDDYVSRTNGLVVRPVILRDYVGIDEVEAEAIKVYASEHTIYCEEAFQIYTTTGLDVTHLNGALEGIYIVKTEKGNQLISVW